MGWLFVSACGATRATDPPSIGGESASDAGATSVDGSADDRSRASEPPRCGEVRNVASADELVAEVDKLPWQTATLGRTLVLSSSDDLVATADLELDAASLPTAPSCVPVAEGAEPDCQVTLFRDVAFPAWSGPSKVAGVTCAKVGPRPTRRGGTCAALRIAKGTRFRLRAVVEGMHPGLPSVWPSVEIERPCTAACDTNEVRCAATQTCLPEGQAACLYCEAGEQAECACRARSGSVADGTACSYDEGPDLVAGGTCEEGRCQ